MRWGLIATIETDDLEAAANVTRAWAPIEYTHLDRKPAGMQGHIIGLGPVLLGHWGGTCAKLIRATVPQGGVAMMVPTHGLGRYGTTAIEPGGGILATGGADVAMYTGAAFRSLLVATSRARWHSFLDACGFIVPLNDGTARPLTAPTVDTRFAESMAAAISCAARVTPAKFQESAQRAALEDQLLLLLSQVLGLWREPLRRESRNSAARHRAAVRAREYIDANLDQGLSLPVVCQAAYSSARALEYAFREMFGLTPMAYVKCARLSRVRRELLNSGKPRISVTAVATHWGFWHLGQFSKDYRSLFGELPSATLARADA